MDEKKTSLSLWTRDFKIITIGSVVSMLGNQIAGFSMSLLVLDYTSSTLLYAIYLMCYTIPQIILPTFAGSILDRFSRKKAIWMLDFTSAALYLAMAIILSTGWFNFPVFALTCVLIGSINSVYSVAYNSFYPLLITEGNMNKAYSVASLLESFVVIGAPISAMVYQTVGIVPLLFANSACFLIAAIFETQIKAKEDYIEKQKLTKKEVPLLKQTLLDTKEGFNYLKENKGLLFIALYFTFNSISGSFQGVTLLPYMKNTYANGALLYSLVGVCMTAGRGAGSLVNYRLSYPKDKKYYITLFVYVTLAFSFAIALFLPLWLMFVVFFITGILGVTSYTLRAAATQTYVPDEKKGRFNGAFNMMAMFGSLVGEGAAGVLSERFELRTLFVCAFVFEGICALIFIGGHKKEIAPIYDR